MKYLLILISITLLTFNYFSQEKIWSLGVVGSPNFYSIKPFSGFNHSYSSKTGISLGFEATYSFSKRVELGSGIGISSLNYQVNYVFLTPSSNQNDPYVPVTSNTKANYIDIPLFLRINVVSNSKITLYPSLAINASLLANSEDKTTFEDNSTRESNYLNSFIMSTQFGLGFGYNLTPKMKLKFETSYRYYLNGFDIYMQEHPTLIQTKIGFEYRFTKID